MALRTNHVRLGLEVLEGRDLPSGVLAGSTVGSPSTTTAQAASVTSSSASVISANVLKPSANSLGGARLTFDRPMNPATFRVSDDTLLGPNNQKISITSIKVVAGTNNTTFDFICAPQTALGTYKLTVGNAYDPAGHAMNKYQASFTLTAPAPTTSTFTNSSPLPITPGGRAVSLLRVDQSMVIGHLSVKLNINYPADNDLVIHLQAPNGMDITLTKFTGSSLGHNFVNTVFDDNGHTWALMGTAPYTGTFQPMVPLSLLNGNNAQGLWKLWVENPNGRSTGTVVNWSLTVSR